MNIKLELEDGTTIPVKFKVINGELIISKDITKEKEQEHNNLFPRWEKLESIGGYWVTSYSTITKLDIKYGKGIGHENVFSTEYLAKAAIATARISQTYRRYRELVGECDYWGIIRCYGLLSLAFRNVSDWNLFYESNKEDLDLIGIIVNNIQL